MEWATVPVSKQYAVSRGGQSPVINGFGLYDTLGFFPCDRARHEALPAGRPLSAKWVISEWPVLDLI